MSDRAGPAWSDIGNLWEKITELQNKQAEDRRDRFAAAALQGLLARYGTATYNEEEIAVKSRKHADVLIAALDKEQP